MRLVLSEQDLQKSGGRDNLDSNNFVWITCARLPPTTRRGSTRQSYLCIERNEQKRKSS
jgi:hypothetical protein